MNEVVANSSMPIDIKLIYEDPANIRKIPPTEAEEEAFRLCLSTMGQLVPVLVGLGEEGRYKLIAGARRLRHARALGWSKVDAIVRTETSDAALAEIQAAENAQRSAMHPIDMWRGYVSLQERGVTAALAAQCLGIDERTARRYDKLGRAAPEMLELFRTHGIPPDNYLGQIVRATAEDQAAVLRSKVGRNAVQKTSVRWWEIADALRPCAIPLANAIFDWEASGVVFQRDAFAEPGSAEEWMTSDRDGFNKAQRAAMLARVQAEAKSKVPVAVAAWDGKNGRPEIPEGYTICQDIPSGKGRLAASDPRRKLVALDTTTGRVVSAWVTKVGRAGRVKPKAKPLARGAAGPSGQAATEAEDTSRMTKRGEEICAQAKTRAIRNRFAEDGPEMASDLLLRLLCLAIAGQNVEVRPADNRYGRIRFDDVLSALVDPGRGLNMKALVAPVAASILERLVQVTNPVSGLGSGPVAEIIGVAISAEAFLERFDTEAFLDTLRLPALVALRDSLGMSSTLKTATAIRNQARHRYPEYAPNEARFVLPGTVAETPTEEEGGDDEE